MTGHQNAACARAAVEDATVKRNVFEAVMTDLSIPNDTRWAMVSGFWTQARTNPALYTQFVADYFNLIERVWAENTFHTAEDIAILMFPTDIAGYAEGVDIVAAGQEWIASHTEVSAALVRIIRERVDVARRQIEAQKADA
ncbi:aminopeptidase N [Chlamydia trachomatis]|nr:aminopeptidase N [Chlamydia trachomatis]